MGIEQHDLKTEVRWGRILTVNMVFGHRDNIFEEIERSAPRFCIVWMKCDGDYDAVVSVLRGSRVDI